MPIAGFDPSKLHGNFEEMRGGHRHEALDIMAPRGTPVLAVAQGNVAGKKFGCCTFSAALLREHVRRFTETNFRPRRRFGIPRPNIFCD